MVLPVTDLSDYDYPGLASQALSIVDTRNAFKGIAGRHICQIDSMASVISSSRKLK